MYLQSLGATPAIYGAFEPHAAHGLILARVAISQRDQYRLYSEAGELDAEPSGALWHRTPGPRVDAGGRRLGRRPRGRTRAGDRRRGAAAPDAVLAPRAPAGARISSRSRRTSTWCFSSAGSTAISICGGWSATWR